MRRASARLARRAGTVRGAWLAAALAGAVGACGGGSDGPGPGALLGVPEQERLSLPCLRGPVQVVRTEHDVPHVYGADPLDVACVVGFLQARDRYFELEMGRRFGRGRLSEVLGSLGLPTDVANRTLGMARVAEQLIDHATPDARARAEALVAGVNAWLARARTGREALPTELVRAAPLLGVSDAAALLHDWDVYDVGGIGVVPVYRASFTTRELDLTAALAAVSEGRLPEGLPARALRALAYRADVLGDVRPVVPARTVPAEGAVRASRGALAAARPAPAEAPVAGDLDSVWIRRAADRLRALPWRGAGDERTGSNIWMVAPERSASGHALFATDGHLALTVPATFWTVHTDTALFNGGEGERVIGTTLPGLPVVPVGHNGRVAFGQTQSYADVLDWYSERVRLGPDGRPAAVLSPDGSARPLTAVTERYVVAPVLGDAGGTLELPRWETPEGRPLFALAGTEVDGPAGHPRAVNVGGVWVEPPTAGAETSGVGGLTFAYSGLYERGLLDAFLAIDRARTVDDVADAQRAFAGYGGNIGAADVDGNLYLSGFEAVPCRGYLPAAGGEGRAAPDPMRVLDGRDVAGSFVVRFDDAGRVDPAPADPLACSLPFDAFPHVRSPAQGYALNANNDPNGATLDGDPRQDGVYLGAHWDPGFRAGRIEERLAARDDHDLDSMRALQNDHRSGTAALFLPFLFEAVERVRAGAPSVAGGPVEPAARAAARLAAAGASADDALARLRAWADAGHEAASGVETFYDAPTDADRANAVATMVYHAFLGRLIARVVGDEGLPAGAFQPYRDDGELRAVYFALRARAPDGGVTIAGVDPETRESVLFDVVGTDARESSDEDLVGALLDGLAWLASPPAADGSGGFGTADPAAWLWGLRHGVRFESIVAGYIAGAAGLDSVLSLPKITPAEVAVTDPPPAAGDPRAALRAFPRPGDANSVDAAGRPALTDFTYYNGPVARVAIELDPAGPRGTCVLPGGQSGLVESAFFSDQARLWLANRTYPLRFSVEEVLEGAVGRQVFEPPAPAAP